MKSLNLNLIFLILLTFIFAAIVFLGNISSIGLERKKYFNQFTSLRKNFDREISLIEKSVHESFLSYNHNLILIESITRRKMNPGREVGFTKSKHLNNFAIINSQKEVIFQIQPESNSYVNQIDFKKMRDTIGDSLFFIIPYEVESQKFFLTFEYSVSYFLEQAFLQLKEYSGKNILKLPKILIQDVKDGPHLSQDNLNKIEFQSKTCFQNNNGICSLYIASLQKRLLIDKNNYNGFSAGFLYPSNPLDIPPISIIIFIILILLTMIVSIIILVKSWKKSSLLKKYKVDIPKYLSDEHATKNEVDPSKTDSANNSLTSWKKFSEKKTTAHEGKDSQEKQEEFSDFDEGPVKNISTENDDYSPSHLDAEIDELIKLDHPDLSENNKNTEDGELKSNPEMNDLSEEDIPNLNEKNGSTEETLPESEDNEVNIPEIDDSIYSHSPSDSSQAIDKELSDLYQEINSTEMDNLNPTSNKENTQPSESIKKHNSILNKEFHDFSIKLVKTFFPKRNLNKTEELLKEFPHAQSLLFLELENKTYQCKESLFSDSETINKCKIPEDDYIITEFLNRKKGILINKNEASIPMMNSWVSNQELEKTDQLFIFSLNYGNKKYIFILY